MNNENNDNRKKAEWYDALCDVMNMGLDLESNSAEDLLGIVNEYIRINGKANIKQMQHLIDNGKLADVDKLDKDQLIEEFFAAAWSYATYLRLINLTGNLMEELAWAAGTCYFESYITEDDMNWNDADEHLYSARHILDSLREKVWERLCTIGTRLSEEGFVTAEGIAWNDPALSSKIDALFTSMDWGCLSKQEIPDIAEDDNYISPFEGYANDKVTKLFFHNARKAGEILSKEKVSEK